MTFHLDDLRDVDPHAGHVSEVHEVTGGGRGIHSRWDVEGHGEVVLAGRSLTRDDAVYHRACHVDLGLWNTGNEQYQR